MPYADVLNRSVSLLEGTGTRSMPAKSSTAAMAMAAEGRGFFVGWWLIQGLVLGAVGGGAISGMVVGSVLGLRHLLGAA